jgi:type 1 fimbria pilin
MKPGRFARCLTRAAQGALLAVALLVLAMRPAFAAKSPACTASPQSQAISIPSPVGISPGTSNGKIGQPSPPVTVSIDCLNAFMNTTNYYDYFDLQTGNISAIDFANAAPGGVGVMLQTNVRGIDVLLTATPSQASSGNNGPNGTIGWSMGTVKCDSGNSSSNYCIPNPISETFTAQLVKTGTVSPGTINNIKILQFFDTDNNQLGRRYTASNPFGSLALNPVTISANTCNVTAGSSNINVILPTIATNALPSTGSVAGQTGFSIQYSCSVGWSLYMTMSTTRPGTATGVILSAATCTQGTSAANIGIQVLQNNLQPVQFDVAQPLGNSPNGVLTLNYYAQYYATGSPTGPGPVCGTGTFTMSYQ